MKLKKIGLMSIFAVLAANLPLYAMEDRGSKRNYDEANPLKNTLTVNKKRKKVSTEPAMVNFVLQNDEEVTMPIEVARMSPTLREFIDETLNAQENDGTLGASEILQVHLGVDTPLDRSKLQTIQDLLTIMFKKQENEMLTQEDREFLKGLKQNLDDATNTFNQLLTYFDVTETFFNIFDEEFYSLICHDNVRHYISADALYYYDHFKPLLNQNFKESSTKCIATELSSFDLDLLILLMEKTKPYLQQIQELQEVESIKEEFLQHKYILKQSLMNIIIETIQNNYNEQNSIVDLLQQCEQWQLGLFKHALFKFAVINTNLDEMQALLANVTFSLYDQHESFVDQETLPKLFPLLLDEFIGWFTTNAESYDLKVTFTIFESFFKNFQNLRMNFGQLIKEQGDKLDFIIEHGQEISQRLQSQNSREFAAFECCMQFLAEYKFKNASSTINFPNPVFIAKGCASNNLICLSERATHDEITKELYFIDYLTGKKAHFPLVKELSNISLAVPVFCSDDSAVFSAIEDGQFRTISLVRSVNDVPLNLRVVYGARALFANKNSLVYLKHNKINFADFNNKHRTCMSSWDPRLETRKCFMVGNDKIIIQAGSCRVVIFDLEKKTRSILYVSEKNVEITALVPAADDKIICANANGELFYINVNDKSTELITKIDKAIINNIFLSDNKKHATITYKSNTISGGFEPYKIVCLDLENKVVVKSLNLGDNSQLVGAQDGFLIFENNHKQTIMIKFAFLFCPFETIATILKARKMFFIH